MEPSHISWIAVIFGGSLAAKVLGLFLRNRNPGMVSGPVFGVVGGIVLWQSAIAMNVANVEDPVLAGLLGSTGGLFAFLAVALLKRPS